MRFIDYIENAAGLMEEVPIFRAHLAVQKCSSERTEQAIANGASFEWKLGQVILHGLGRVPGGKQKAHSTTDKLCSPAQRYPLRTTARDPDNL